MRYKFFRRRRRRGLKNKTRAVQVLSFKFTKVRTKRASFTPPIVARKKHVNRGCLSNSNPYLCQDNHGFVRGVNSLFFITLSNQRPYNMSHFYNDRRQPARYRESDKKKERRDKQPKVIKSRQLSISLLESDFGNPIIKICQVRYVRALKSCFTVRLSLNLTVPVSNHSATPVFADPLSSGTKKRFIGISVQRHDDAVSWSDKASSCMRVPPSLSVSYTHLTLPTKA